MYLCGSAASPCQYIQARNLNNGYLLLFLPVTAHFTMEVKFYIFVHLWWAWIARGLNRKAMPADFYAIYQNLPMKPHTNFQYYFAHIEKYQSNKLVKCKENVISRNLKNDRKYWNTFIFNYNCYTNARQLGVDFATLKTLHFRHFFNWRLLHESTRHPFDQSAKLAARVSRASLFDLKFDATGGLESLSRFLAGFAVVVLQSHFDARRLYLCF